MAKRFIDTGFYKSPFVRGLKGSLKGLYSYIICDCDGAGIWVKDLEIASMYIGFKISETDFNVFIESGKAIDLKNGKYFFPDFLEHQYPKGLSIHNPAQKNFILELQKNSMIDSDLKPLWSTFKGTKVMVMEKEKVMVMEKVKEKEPEIFKTELEKKVNDFYKFRKEMKKPILEASKESFLKKLNKLSGGVESVAIEILDQSIANGWQGIFELKNSTNGKGQTNTDAALKFAE